MRKVLLFFVLILTFGALSAQSLREQLGEGVKLSGEGKYNEAIDVFSEILQKQPNSAIVLTRRAIAYYNLGNYNNASLDLAKATSVNAENHVAWYFLGRIDIDKKSYRSAINSLDKAISFNSSSSEYFLQRGISKYQLERYEEAKKDFDQAVRLEGNYWELVWLGNAQLMIGDYTNSRNSYDKALAQNPDEWMAYNQMGLLSSKLGNLQQALDYYKLSLNITQDSSSTHSNLAALQNKFGNYSQALGHAEDAIRLEVTNANAHAHKSFALWNLNRYSESRQSANTAIRHDENYNQSYYYLALAQESLGALDVVETHLLKALELTESFDPFYKVVYDKLKAFRDKSEANVPPQIILTNPVLSKSRGFNVVKAADFEVNENSLWVEGTIKSSNGIRSLTINGASVSYSENGYFSTDISLNRGNNEIEVNCEDNRGLTSQTKFTVKSTYVAKPEPETPKVAVNDRYYALLVGVDNYQDYGISDLAKPIIDAKKVENVLTEKYGFAPADVFLLTDPDRGKFYSVVENISKIIRPDDNLLIFYAGHGYWDSKYDAGYWLLSDAVPSNRSSWLSNNELKTLLNGLNTRHTLVIADACYSGSLIKSRDLDFNIELQSLYASKSRKAMTSGSLKTVPDESVFLYYLIKRLEENDKKFLRAEYLFNSLRDEVMINTENTPLYGDIPSLTQEGGDFLFKQK